MDSLNKTSTFNVKKSSSRKKAPTPPKRTSSFREQQAYSAGSREIALPEAVMEMETQTDFPDYEYGGTEDFMYENEKLIDSHFQFLNEPPDQMMRSSSDEKLSSTPGSQSCSGSLERGGRLNLIHQSRSRSSSRERSGDSLDRRPSSSEVLTPDPPQTPELPPPPPSIVNYYPKSPVLAPGKPNLKKARSNPNPAARKSREMEDEVKSEADYSENSSVASLEVSNVKKAINRYGTIPKGARIGAFLASLEQNNQDHKPVIPEEVNSGKTTAGMTRAASKDGHVPKSAWEGYAPPPSLDQSITTIMAAQPIVETTTNGGADTQQNVEHNVKPSSILRSSSSNSVSSGVEKPALTAFFQRQKSDLSGTGKISEGKSETSSNTVTGENDSNVSNVSVEPEKPEKSHIVDWRKVREKPSPRLNVKSFGIRNEGLDPNKREHTGSPATVKKFPSRNPSSSSEEVMMESKSLESVDSLDSDPRSKLSPPVPKKPITRGGSGGKKSGSASTSGAESSMDSSTDSVLDSVQKIKAKFPNEITGGVAIFPVSPSENLRLSSPTRNKANVETSIKHHKGFFGSKKEQHTPDKTSQIITDGNVPASSPKAHKQVLPGARPVLPGSKAVLPTKPQILQRASLHKVATNDSPVDEKPEIEVSKNGLLSQSKELSQSLEALHSTSSKHSSNFMHISEKVNLFYRSCSSYVESLPPHGKFHFRELLGTLQKLSENLKTCPATSKDSDTLLSDLQHSIKEIVNVLER